MIITQMMTPTNPLEIHFEYLGKQLVLDVELIALVDYDGDIEIEYGAIIDGQMMLFHVDGTDVTLHKKMIPILQFQTVMDKKKQAREGYGL